MPSQHLNPGPSEASPPASFPATPAASTMPDWYPDLLAGVSKEVSTGRIRAISAASRELLMSYWSVGRQLAQRESEQGWGSKVVTRLSADIRTRFPGTKGFSPRNLRYMKTFAQAWPEFPMLQAPLATLPWYHQIALLEKLDDAATRLWYAASAVEHGWSRNVLAIRSKPGSMSAPARRSPTSRPPWCQRTRTLPNKPPEILTYSTSSP